MILVVVGKSAGKTTVATNVAVALASRTIRRAPRRPLEQRRVRLLDADPQASSVEWSLQRTEPPVLVEVKPCLIDTFQRDLPELMEGVDDLVIDCPAGTGRPTPFPDGRIRITRNAILAALGEDNGVVVVPVKPGPFDLWAGDDLIGELERAWNWPGAAPSARSRSVVVLDQVPQPRGGRTSRIERASRARLATGPLAVLETTLFTRDDYQQAPLEGLGVTEAAPRSVAAAEIEALTTELQTLIGEAK